MTLNGLKSSDDGRVVHSADSDTKRMWCPWPAATYIDFGLCRGQAIDQA